MVPEEERELCGGRKLGRRAESAVGRVEAFRQLADGGPDLRLADVYTRGGPGLPAQMLGERVRLLGERVPLPFPGLGDPRQQGGETRPAESIAGRKIGSSEERPLVRREEDGHGPPALAAVCGQRGGHVDVVEIGPLLPVHLDIHKRAIHQGGDGLVLERLPLHHMAPVAGRVADAEEDRRVLRLGPGQRLFSPRVPVHGVVSMLEKIRAGLADQAVGVAGGVG